MNKHFGFSTFFHTALAVGSLYVTVPAIENLNKELITIELESEPALTPPPPPVVKTLEEAKGVETVKPTQGNAQPVFVPAPAALPEAEPAEKIAASIKKSKSSVEKSAQIKTQTGPSPKPIAQPPQAVAKTSVSRAGISETLEDIAADDLDTDSVEVAQIGNLGDNEFENEFKNIDQSNAALVKAQKAAFDEEAKQVADEKDAAMKAIEDANAADAKAMEDALKATRDKNAAVLAQMKATERAAAEKATRDAQIAATLAAQKQAASDQARQGRGNGASGADEASAAQAGTANGVRSLDQIRQRPGNPKPNYSNDERLRREQGAVVFHAFISRDGSPTQFQIIKSTGYRNLDGKTLSALKKWKFYPGQEGWVEIPFKWDLKGGVEEMSTLLRRFGSR